jgi:hypothetical protein
MSGEILEDARAFAVLMRRQLLDHPCAEVSRAGEGSIDVLDAP